MSLDESLINAETALIASLTAKQSGIDDRTGKGSATECVITDDLVKPNLPPNIRCSKGAVVTADDPSTQSPAIDRVVYDPTAASPLIYAEAHSIFPIEAVVGLIEITMCLDATKLREDIGRMAPVKKMRRRRYLVPVPGSSTRACPQVIEWLSPRSFVVGLPADPNWSPKAIAAALRSVQLDIGSPTHIHGLYVLGIGFFETMPTEAEQDLDFKVRAWTGADRMFRFASILRQSLDRWQKVPTGWSANLQEYVSGRSEILAE